MSRRTTLFVAGIPSRTRARDLAKEFERFGRLVRCDIPAPKSFQARPYAFVEFEDPRDAEDAYDTMQGKNFDGYPLNVQWAKQPPNRSWRYEGDERRDRGGRDLRDYRERSYSPRRNGDRRRSRSPPRRERRRSRSKSYERAPRREDDRRDYRDEEMKDVRNGDDRREERREDIPNDRDRSISPRREPEEDDRRRDDDEDTRVRRSPVPSE
ncbi:hypothetical protein HK098_005266 [Nowakowskiella sp. JEL0407]|nr:hypothetical protein HK098_005266 [Nowakowskiella sp. JEL0407]